MAVNPTTTNKEKILKKVRQALIYKSKPRFANIDLESPIYAKQTDSSLLETFARNYTQIKGQFVICDNKFDFVDKLLTLQERKKLKKFHCWEENLQLALKDSGIHFYGPNEAPDKINVGITGCEALIARTGSVLISSAGNSHKLTIYPSIHIVIAYASQVVYELKDGLQKVKNKYGKNLPSMLSYISGPSVTNAIGNEPVLGAMGPLELYVFLIDDESHN